MVKPIISLKNQLIISSSALLISCAIVYRVIEHLPIIDFRAYKIEANIIENMTIPEDAPRDIWKYDWKFIVDGKVGGITRKLHNLYWEKHSDSNWSISISDILLN